MNWPEDAAADVIVSPPIVTPATETETASSRKKAVWAATIAMVMVGVAAIVNGVISLAVDRFAPLDWSLLMVDPLVLPYDMSSSGAPIRVLASALTFVLLVAGTWLLVLGIVRSGAPGRGMAVFFGVWGAIVLTTLFAVLLCAPLRFPTSGLFTEESMLPLDLERLRGFVLAAAGWAVAGGWIPAVVVTFIHVAAAGAGRGASHMPPNDGSERQERTT